MSIEIQYPDLRTYSHKNLFPTDDNTPINGLGNILYRISSQYGLCKKYGLISRYFFLNEFINYGMSINMFDNWKNTILLNLDLNHNEEKINITLHESKKAHIYDDSLVSNIIKNKDTNILIKNSYLQSLQYFHEYENEIQDLFSPDEPSLNIIHNKFPQLKTENTINISLHLRLEWGDNLIYTANFYEDSINFFEKKYNNSNFKINYFVFSDNIKKAKNILSSIKKSFIYCEKNHDYIDMWIMAACNHNIICHSTLGWWGAYLNKNKDKCVLYPSDVLSFFCKKILGRNNLNEIQNNIYPKKWICMNSNSMHKDSS